LKFTCIGLYDESLPGSVSGFVHKGQLSGYCI